VKKHTHTHTHTTLKAFEMKGDGVWSLFLAFIFLLKATTLLHLLISRL